MICHGSSAHSQKNKTRNGSSGSLVALVVQNSNQLAADLARIDAR